MFKKLSALMAVLFTMSLAVIPTMAQDLESADDLTSMGVESGYMRMYAADPDAAADSAIAGYMAIGFEFDSAASIDDDFEDFVCGFASGFIGFEDAFACDDLEEEGIDITGVTNVGDQALEIIGDADFDGDLIPVVILAVQQDNYLFMVITIGDDTPEASDAFAKFLLDSEPGTRRVRFNEDGTSTGGFFDMLPQVGDKVIDGMVPLLDMDFFADSTATPSN